MPSEVSPLVKFLWTDPVLLVVFHLHPATTPSNWIRCCQKGPLNLVETNGSAGGGTAQSVLFGSSLGLSSWGGDESSASKKRTTPAPIGLSNSALASMLGIELPTGSGSLRESGVFPSDPVASQPFIK